MENIFKAFIMAFLLLTAGSTQAQTANLKVNFDKYGAFKICDGQNKELLSAGLFFAVKSENTQVKDSRFFQNSNYLKEFTMTESAKDGNKEFLASPELEHKELQLTVPFTEKILLSGNTVKINYQIAVSESLAFREAPRLLIYSSPGLLEGKGMELTTELNSDFKVFPEKYEKATAVFGNRLKLLKMATDSGVIELIPEDCLISMHDTRAYSNPGGLRIDVEAKKAQAGIWIISCEIKLNPKNSAAASINEKQNKSASNTSKSSGQIKSEAIRVAALAEKKQIFTEKDQLEYQPDFSTWSIYGKEKKSIPLSGWWKIKLLDKTANNPENDEGSVAKFYDPSFDDSKWDESIVPQKWSSKTFYKSKSGQTPKNRESFAGVGWYRLSFKAPEKEKGKSVFLRFDEIAMEGKVYLNGELLGSHKNFRVNGMGRTPEEFEFDITDKIKYGKENTIAVRIFQGTKATWVPSTYGGILDAVWLDIRPSVWTEKIFITPDKDLKGFSCAVIPEGNLNDAPVKWSYEVFEWNAGKVVVSGKVPETIQKDSEGRNTLKINTKIKDAKPWSFESPFLYGIRFKNANGEITGAQRFGLRTFEVSGNKFLLNGKPVYLRGMVQGEELISFQPSLFPQNEGDAMRRLFARFREANVNHIRLHSTYMTKIAYDILDENGILVCDELTHPHVMIDNPNKADEISVSNFLFASDENGILRPAFKTNILKRMDSLYSHPSVAMFSFGNEIRDENVFRKMSLNLYDYYKQIDQQKRPVTTSSGRFWKEASNLASIVKGDKLDYIDTHDYTGSINNWPLAFCQPVAEYFIKTAKEVYKDKVVPPIVNGETVYFAPHYYKEFYDGIWDSEDAAEPNWDKYLWALTELHKKHKAHMMMSYYWVRSWGSKGYKYNRHAGRAYYLERILEVQRKMYPDISGYEALTEDYFEDNASYPLKDFKFEPLIGFESMKQVCAPALVVLDHISPNLYAGDSLKLKAQLINNSVDDLKNATLKIVLKNADESLLSKDISAGKVETSSKKILETSLDIPMLEGNGSLNLEYSLYDGEKLLCKRQYSLNVRNRKDVFAPLNHESEILLYDAVENVFTGMGRPSTSAMFNDFGVKFKLLKNFDSLPTTGTIAIGANSFDSSLLKNGDKLRTFMENGGRLIVFEQQYSGRAPFATELEYRNAGYGQFAEIVRAKHPAIDGMKQNEFLCWDQKDWSIYHYHIRPLAETTVLTGGDSTTWGSDNFGMVLSEGKIGKGSLLICQAEITRMYKTDSGAGILASNILKHCLKSVDSSKLPSFRGEQSKIKALSQDKAFFLPLETASNMGFADDQAGDGKGGWTDQGSKNDLRMLRAGEQIFGGIPFKIINPEANNGKSCVVISKNPTLKFPAESKEIPVNAKLKRLIFLHTGAWMPESGKTGTYLIRYEDGSVSELPLESGINIGDWWGAASLKLKQAESVWTANNGESVVGLYAFSWDNPKGDVPIKSIILRGEGNAVTALVAVTGERP